MFLFLNKGIRTSVGEISRNFHAYTLEISHNMCTTPNEPTCKRPRRTDTSKVWPTSIIPVRSTSWRFVHSTPHYPQPMSLNGSHCLIIKIKLKVSSGSVLLYDWLAYLFFFAEPELVNHILGNPWLLSCWLVWYGLMEESLLSHLMCLEKILSKGQDESVLARFGQPILPSFVLNRDGLRTLTLTLPNLWV